MSLSNSVVLKYVATSPRCGYFPPCSGSSKLNARRAFCYHLPPNNEKILGYIIFFSAGIFGIKRLSWLLILLLLPFQLVFSLPAGAASSDWKPGQYKIKSGAAISDGDSWALTPSTAGLLSLVVPAGQRLDSQTRLTLSYEGPSPQRFFVSWQTDSDNGKTFQIEMAPPIAGTIVYDLSGIPDWEGAAKSLILEFILLPDQKIRVWKILLSSPTLTETLYDYWYTWAGEQFWSAADINRVIGAGGSTQGPYPVPFFAGLTALALVLLGLLQFIRSGRWFFNWRIAGGIILCIWILSDSFWHLRLWRQVSQTWDTFAGKTIGEKLLASPDAGLVQLTQKAKERIHDKRARVFIASAGDFTGMIAAYYMAPFNTYWHRRGPELPSGKHFIRGDYILFIRPSNVVYDAKSGVIRFPGEADLRVRREYIGVAGALFRVI